MRKYHFLYLLVSLCLGQLNAAQINWQGRVQEAAQCANVAAFNHVDEKESREFISNCLCGLFADFAEAQCDGMPLLGRDGAPNPKRAREAEQAYNSALERFLQGGLPAIQQAIAGAQREAVLRQLSRLQDLSL